jgi:hypothetical protein
MLSFVFHHCILPPCCARSHSARAPKIENHDFCIRFSSG